MSRRVLIPVVALAVMALLGGAGAYAYYFSGLRTSPASLSLSSPAPTASASPTASPSVSPTAFASTGTWQISANSLAGYRVKEQFVGQTSSHEAVARTSEVTARLRSRRAAARIS